MKFHVHYRAGRYNARMGNLLDLSIRYVSFVLSPTLVTPMRSTLPGNCQPFKMLGTFRCCQHVGSLSRLLRRIQSIVPS